MNEEESSIKIINGIKSVLQQLPSVNYGNYVVPNLVIEGFGDGQVGYDLLKREFEQLDFTKPTEFLDLEKQIKRQKKK